MPVPTRRLFRPELLSLEERAVPATTGTGTSTGTTSTTGTTSSATSALNTLTSAATGTTGTTGTQSSTSTATTTSPPPAPPPLGRGATPNVIVADDTGATKVTVSNLFEATFTGGLWTARADVTGDGVADTIVGPGPGMQTHVRVLDGTDGRVVRTFLSFESTFTGGIFLTAADITGDGRADIIVSADTGGGPRVRIFDGFDNHVIADFLAIDDPNFRGGVRVSAGDINADGTPDLIVAAGVGGGPRIALFDGRSVASGNPTRLTPDFFAFESTLRDGVYVSAGFVNNDKYADLMVGGGPNGAPRVMILDGLKLTTGGASLAVDAPLANFFAGLGDDRTGVRIGAFNGTDGRADVLAVVGSGGLATLYDGATGKATGTTKDRTIALNGGLLDDDINRAYKATTTPTSTASTTGTTGASTGTTGSTATTGTSTTSTTALLNSLTGSSGTTGKSG